MLPACCCCLPAIDATVSLVLVVLVVLLLGLLLGPMRSHQGESKKGYR
jgi:hypothetical protein